MYGLDLSIGRASKLAWYDKLVKSAGGVLYYDARKDTVHNGLSSDKSGRGNHITWEGFSGDATSGLIKGVSKPYRRFDGVGDFGSLVNTASVDITTAPLAVFMTLRIAVGSTSRYLICKNLDAATNIQYAILFDSGSVTVPNSVKVYVSSTGTNSAQDSVMPGQWCNVGFIWDGTRVQPYVNYVPSGAGMAYSGTPLSRPYLRIGRREPAASQAIGDIATTTIYAGAKATPANILKAERALAKLYTS